MTTELTPHIAYPKDGSEPAIECADYLGAFRVWKQRHHWKSPWLIKTKATGRVIEPDAEITDVNE